MVTEETQTELNDECPIFGNFSLYAPMDGEISEIERVRIVLDIPNLKFYHRFALNFTPLDSSRLK